MPCERNILLKYGYPFMTFDPATQIAENLRTGLAADLVQLESEGKAIRVGVIGCGEMGTDLITAIAPMKGINVVAVADRRLQGAPAAIRIAGYDDDKGVICESTGSMSKAIERGAIAISQSAENVIGHQQVDVIIDATGRPVAGAEVGMKAMEAGKHLVMMNVEADVTIGPYLRNQAEKLGVVYTVGAGDEPSSTMELINFVAALGYPVVAAGKGKNNAFNIDDA